MNKANGTIEDVVKSILKDFGITEPSVSVSVVAKKAGIELIPYEFGENISGALFIEDGKATIGYSPSEPVVRQRFTVAHELGHYFLHQDANSSLFFDKTQILFRDELNSSGRRKEREANAFAASLLMPQRFINNSLARIRKTPGRLTDEEIIRELANEYKVSQIAMSYRLGNLGHMNY
jgi:Zn-dependent peptidase ImmA (M78 family)